MSNLPHIKALVFVLKGGSPWTEIVFLNQNLAMRAASIVRRFHAHLLRAFAHRLLDFVESREIARGWSNSTTMCSAVSGRALIKRVPPGPDCPSSIFSTG
jgi:hypothetical protein